MRLAYGLSPLVGEDMLEGPELVDEDFGGGGGGEDSGFAALFFEAAAAAAYTDAGIPPNLGGAAAAAAAFSRSIRASAAAAANLAIAIPPRSVVGFSRFTTLTGLASSPLNVSAADAPSSSDTAESLLVLLALEPDAFADAPVDAPFALPAVTLGGLP